MNVTNKIAHKYAEDVVSGKILAGKYIKLACKRHLEDLKFAGKRGFYFSNKAAEHILEFFKFLKHSKGEWAGQPLTLEPWQQFVLCVQFGWLNKKTGLRRFRLGYSELPRKNGKSTLSAGKGLYLLVGDNEAGAEVYTAATKKDQAKIIFSEAVRMVKASPFLKSIITSYRDNLNIANTASKFEPLGADEDTMDGLNVHAGLIDEFHAHKTRGVLDIIETAIGSRRQPLIDIITTAGSSITSPCYELHEYGIRVLENQEDFNDDTFFVFIAGADKDDDWTKEETWIKANPNYGISVKVDDLRAKVKRAIEIPSYQNTFKRLQLNIWTSTVEKWLDVDKWKECKADFCEDDLIGKDCFAGLDLSTTSDTTALVLIFDHEDKIRTLQYFFIPEDNAKKNSDRDRVNYVSWCNHGHVIATPGNVVDYEFIIAKVDELSKKFNIKEIAADPWNATQTITILTGKGHKIVPFRQGFGSMSAPSKELEKLIMSKKIEHNGNPCLSWMIGNAIIAKDPAGNIKPTKEKSNGRIDGVVSMIMAIGARSLAPEEPDFIYNKSGVYVG